VALTRLFFEIAPGGHGRPAFAEALRRGKRMILLRQRFGGQEAKVEKNLFGSLQCHSRESRIFGKTFQFVLPNDK
jgi:hypothetical protein